MAPIRRWATLALLIIAPSVAAAQQQQGRPRDSDHLSRARSLIQKRRFADALAVFDSLLRADPGSRDAALGRAQMLAWLSRFNDAIRAYQRWVEAHPKDVEALERLAQVLTWAGRSEDAERLYKILALGGSVEAERGLARLAARRGDLAESERRWRAIVAKHPQDSESWAGLGQTLRWRNRPRAARAAYARAVQLDGTNRDAAEQLKWLDGMLAPHVDPVFASTKDTDGNRLTTIGATASMTSSWEGELSVRAQRRAATLGAARTTSLGAAMAASHSIGRVAFRGALGATRLDDASTTPSPSSRALLTATAAASAGIGRRMHVVGVIARDAFDETVPLMRLGIATTAIGGGASFDLGRGLRVSAEMERAELSGATPNSRMSGAGSLTWRAPWVLSLATTVRTFGYAVDPAEGYFAPRRYLLAETGAQIAIGGSLGWSLSLGGGIGAQSVDLRTVGSTTRAAGRGDLAIAYRPSPGFEWIVSGTTTNAASPATSSLASYRTKGVSVKARVKF